MITDTYKNIFKFIEDRNNSNFTIRELYGAIEGKFGTLQNAIYMLKKRGMLEAEKGSGRGGELVYRKSPSLNGLSIESAYMKSIERKSETKNRKIAARNRNSGITGQILSEIKVGNEITLESEFLAKLIKSKVTSRQSITSLLQTLKARGDIAIVRKKKSSCNKRMINVFGKPGEEKKPEEKVNKIKKVKDDSIYNRYLFHDFDMAFFERHTKVSQYRRMI